MSNIYIKEPPTCGKVLVHTSLGDLDFELWSKEAPKACRNFVQLCMEGYYNNLTFHRIVKDFMIQGGDPTGTGEGGESIYGKPFKDEFHSRLRFVRRGLVAMANSAPNDNGSQFFITLGPCNDLNKKHTIFAKVAGDTIYNLVRLGEVNVDKNEKPINPPIIKWTKILANPFDDIIPRNTDKNDKNSKKKKEREVKAVKNFKLLSFGDEAFEDEQDFSEFDCSAPKKSKSSHDLLEDPTLSSKTLEEVKEEENKEDEIKESDSMEVKVSKIRDKLTNKDKPENETKNVWKINKDNIEDEADSVKRLQQESKKIAREILLAKRKENQKEESKEENKVVEVVEEPKEADNSIYGQYKAQKKLFKQKAKSNRRTKEEKARKTEERLSIFVSKLNHLKSIMREGEDKEEGEEEGEEVENSGEKIEEKLDKSMNKWFIKSFVNEKDELRDAKDMNREVNEDRYHLYDPRNPINQRKSGAVNISKGPKFSKKK